MGWAGGNGGGGNMPQVAGRAGSGPDDFGRARRCRDGRRGHQRHPARRRRIHSAASSISAARTTPCRAATTPTAQGPGLRSPVRAHLGVRRQSDVRRPDRRRTSCGSTSTYRQTGGKSTVPGMFWNKNAGDPTKWIVDFDRSKPAFTNRVERQATLPGDVAGDAAQQVQHALGRAVPRLELRRGGRRRDGRPLTTPEATAAVVLHPVPSTERHMVVADLGTVAGRGRLGHVSGPIPLRATERRHRRSGDDPGPGAGRRGSEPPLARAGSPREAAGTRIR